MQVKDKEYISKFINEVDNEFTEIKGGSFVYLETGEFFTKAEHDKYVQMKLEEIKIQIFQNINREAEEKFDIKNDQILINKRSKKPKNKTNLRQRYEGGNFNIVYTEKLEVLNSMVLNNNEKLVYYVLRDYIQYPTNCIVINDKIPSIKELEPLIGLTERTIIDVLQSLEKKNLIKRKQSGHKKAIYFNPEYYASGKELEIETLKMFNLLECDDEKINYYMKSGTQNSRYSIYSTKFQYHL